MQNLSLFSQKRRYLFFDTETTGLPNSWAAPVTDLANWPRIVQLAWQVHDEDGTQLYANNLVIRPEGFIIPAESALVHGITHEQAMAQGVPIKEALETFRNHMQKSHAAVAHNISFDEKVVGAEFLRLSMPNPLLGKKGICTKELATEFCAIPNLSRGGYKWPKLSELHEKLFGESFADSHNAAADVGATAKCFFALKELGIVASL